MVRTSHFMSCSRGAVEPDAPTHTWRSSWWAPPSVSSLRNEAARLAAAASMPRHAPASRGPNMVAKVRLRGSMCRRHWGHRQAAGGRTQWQWPCDTAAVRAHGVARHRAGRSVQGVTKGAGRSACGRRASVRGVRTWPEGIRVPPRVIVRRTASPCLLRDQGPGDPHVARGHPCAACACGQRASVCCRERSRRELRRRRLL